MPGSSEMTCHLSTKAMRWTTNAKVCLCKTAPTCYLLLSIGDMSCMLIGHSSSPGWDIINCIIFQLAGFMGRCMPCALLPKASSAFLDLPVACLKSLPSSKIRADGTSYSSQLRSGFCGRHPDVHIWLAHDEVHELAGHGDCRWLETWNKSM